jgi:hypothetical protein
MLIKQRMIKTEQRRGEGFLLGHQGILGADLEG